MKMKLHSTLAIILLMIMLFSVYSEASNGLDSYIWVKWADNSLHAVSSPSPYDVERVIQGKDLGTKEFKEASDIFLTNTADMYIVDTGNNRILQIGSDNKLKKDIDFFYNEGKKDSFNKPKGIFVNEQGDMYIADTDNNRIVVCDKDLLAKVIIEKPKSSLLKDNYVFLPSKVTSDKSGRIFVVAINQTQGLMEFEATGEFKGFIGAAKVQFNLFEYLWKKIATKEQREQLSLFVPTEYNNVTYDKQGFLYVTTDKVDTSKMKTVKAFENNDFSFVRKLNLSGINVMYNKGKLIPIGDYILEEYSSKKIVQSRFVDSCIDELGIYTAMDITHGRLFGYDSFGNMLYVFGGYGSKDGEFLSPVSIEQCQSKLYVLDYLKNSITIFKTSQYGKLLKESILTYNQGNYEQASLLWEKVYSYNSNFDLAYDGIAKGLVREEKYQEALPYFKLSNNMIGYSKAFRLVRNRMIQNYFSIFIIAMFGVVVIIKILMWIVKKKRGGL